MRGKIVMEKYIFCLAVFAAVLTSCSKEQIIREEMTSPSTFSSVYATFAQTGATKVGMGESDGIRTPLTWHQGDMIVVLNYPSMKYGAYRTSSTVSDGDVTAKFDYMTYPGTHPIVGQSAHMAVYPWDKLNAKDKSLRYDTKQIYEEGSFDRLAMPLTAVNYGEYDFSFSAQAAVLRLKISTEENDVKVGRVVLSSQTKALAGNALPNMSALKYDLPTIDTCHVVSLNCESRVAIGATAKDFCIVVPPQTYPDLTVTVHTDKGDFEVTTTKEATFEAGKVYNINVSGTPVPSTIVEWTKPLTLGKETAESITLKVGYTGEIPSEAKELNQEGTIWEYLDGTDLQIITNKSEISAGNWCLSNAGTGGGLFSGYKKITAINNLGKLNTSDMTDMTAMFFDCSELTSLDLSSFNTAKVTDMSSMFSCCNKLTNLDISKFNTDKVTDMSFMFYFCEGLETLDVASFNTANVRKMNGMFEYCSKLESLDISKFNTSNVEDMREMFCHCGNVSSLDVLNFNTSNVKNMGRMFLSCSALQNLNLSSFNTSNVTDMVGMFGQCYELTGINFGDDFTTGEVIDMSGMFSNCSKLASLDLSSFNTGKVSNMSEMFFQTVKLQSLKLSGTFVMTDDVIKNDMFTGCGAELESPGCEVSGVIGGDAKTALSTDTGWDDEHIHFAAPMYPVGDSYQTGILIGETWWAPVNCGYDSEHPYGLLYQWGRKFGQAYEAGTLALTDNMSKEDDTEANKNKFGNNGELNPNWFEGNPDNTLWNESSRGSNDPCPAGWRVPTSAELSALTANKSSWVSETKQGSGYWFSGSQTYSESVPRIFLAAAGCRLYETGVAEYFNTNGLYWSSSFDNSSFPYAIFFYNESLESYAFTWAFGYSVRCVAE